MADETKKKRQRSQASTEGTCSKKNKVAEQTDTEFMMSMMAEAGCNLRHAATPTPGMSSSELHNLQRRLDLRFQANPTIASKFLSGLASFVDDPNNLKRILVGATDCSGAAFSYTESIARVFLLLIPLQTRLFELLLEKLPEYFNDDCMFMQHNVARLILNQFRWLDFLVDSKSSTEKLLDVLFICPPPLKKEIISFLPDIIGNQNYALVVSSLEQMLQEDSSLVAPVLDSLSNINLEDTLFEQVVTIAISNIRVVDTENLPVVLKFLLQSATPTNGRRIIEQIRANLPFSTISDSHASGNKKLKNKIVTNNTEVLILDTIRSGLRFQNVLGDVFLKEIGAVDCERDHKVIDILLLVIIYANGGPLRKKAEKLLHKKAMCGFFNETLIKQCIEGRRESLQVYFHDMLSICECFLIHKNLAVRKLGIHTYVLLFKEFSTTYYRQEILGALVTHTGSGVSHEVDSALDSLVSLATKHPHELLPISSYINGILDYLEGFEDEHLHKVYKIFSELALMVWSDSNSCNSSIANELFMIVRKQIASPDVKYRRMGVIGTVKLVAALKDAKFISSEVNIQKKISDNVLSLLQVVTDTCKILPSARIFLYDELAEIVNFGELHPTVIDWVSKHTGDFENLFLLDLESGQIQGEVVENEGLRGEIWMNLDGNVSPICMSILPLVASHERSSEALAFLPSYFSLLAAVERVANKGSLESIDALLGCPFYLPGYQLLSKDSWNTLPGTHKKIVCLSLFHAINWIRELLNAFSTQVSDQAENLTQFTREENSMKLLKRVRNVMFLEKLLDYCLKSYSCPLPQLHSFSDVAHTENCAVEKLNTKTKRRKKSNEQTSTGMSKTCKRNANSSKLSQDATSSNGLKQSTLTNFLSKSVKGPSQNDQSSQQPQSSTLNPDKDNGNNAREREALSTDHSELLDISTCSEILEMQRSHFRPLTLSALSVLKLSLDQSIACCSDPAAELPIHLYLIREFRYKLDSLDCLHQQPPFLSSGRKSLSGSKSMTVVEFLEKAQKIFPSLRRHLDCAVNLLTDNCDLYSQHWVNESTSSRNPSIIAIGASRLITAESTIKEILHCICKILSIEDLFYHTSILKALLDAFQSSDVPVDVFTELNSQASITSMELCFCRVYAFLEGMFNKVSCVSPCSLLEIIMTLRAVINCVEALIEKNSESRQRKSNACGILSIVPKLHHGLSLLAFKLLQYDSTNVTDGNGWKIKGDVLQKIIQIYVKYNESPGNCLEEISCKHMPHVPAGKSRTQDAVPGLPTLSSATLLIWYRVQLEEALLLLNKLIKEMLALQKAKTDVNKDTVKKLLEKVHKCVNVLVSLVNLTKIHDKVAMQATAVKYAGKFVDNFLKGFTFLEIHYDSYKDQIIVLVKELQKATRTIQTLCSEAKGFKRTMVTSKIPAVKRSMERYLFCVKALLHKNAHGESFWMGNLKHKDLKGREISSQLPISDDEDEPVNGMPDVEAEDSDGGESDVDKGSDDNDCTRGSEGGEDD